MTEQLFLIKWTVRVPFLSVGQINVYSIYRFQCVSFSFSINIVHILKRLDKKIIILIDQILFFFFFSPSVKKYCRRQQVKRLQCWIGTVVRGSSEFQCTDYSEAAVRAILNRQNNGEHLNT